VITLMAFTYNVGVGMQPDLCSTRFARQFLDGCAKCDRRYGY